PVDIARAMGADILLGSEMSVHRELNELNTPADFLMQTISLLSLIGAVVVVSAVMLYNIRKAVGSQGEISSVG
ncbi:MAG: hypothetical protein IJG56_02630, partial [Clostridia bacterium]|nr:hypothetical protein [Clostridia bacterium]